MMWTVFTYLGSILACDGDAEADVNCRIGNESGFIIPTHAVDMDVIRDQHGLKVFYGYVKQ